MPRYFPHVDGLRAIAVLSVVIYHIRPELLPGGFAGVDVFFVISGFVVTASLSEHAVESFPQFLGLFYSRRLARIAPALLLMLLATTFAYVVLVPPSWLSETTKSVGLAAFWGFSNWVLDNQDDTYFTPRAEFDPYTHTWSLGVEEQYYLIVPLLLFGWVHWRSRSRMRRLSILGMGFLAVLSLLACIRLSTYFGAQYVFYPIAFRFWELAAGVVWYQWSAERGFPGQIRPLYWTVAGFIGMALTAVTLILAAPEAFPWPWALGAVLGTLLLIGNPHARQPDALRSILSGRYWVWLGRRSYSLYLWHWPLIVLARWTVGIEAWPIAVLILGMSVLLAGLSYTFIETPIRQSPWLKSFPAGTRIMGFLLVISLGYGITQILFGYRESFSLNAAVRQEKEWYPLARMETASREHRQCEPRIRQDGFKGVTVMEYLPDECADRVRSQLFVIGDSHAAAYHPMFEQLSAEQGRIVRVYHVAGCAYIDLVPPVVGYQPAKCLRGAKAAMDEVLMLGRPGDTVFLPSLRLPRLVDQNGIVSYPGNPAEPGYQEFRRTPHDIAYIATAVADAPRWFVPFQQAGLRVLVELPKPIFRSPPFRCVDGFNRIHPLCAKGLSEELGVEQAYRAPTVEAIKSLAASHPPLHLWDPLPTLCGQARCEALQDGHPLFFDADHISGYGNGILYPAFRQALTEVERRPIP